MLAEREVWRGDGREFRQRQPCPSSVLLAFLSGGLSRRAHRPREVAERARG